MADVTATNADVIVHTKTFTGTKESKILAHIHFIHLLLPSVSLWVGSRGQSHMEHNGKGIIVMPVDFCCVTCMCIYQR